MKPATLTNQSTSSAPVARLLLAHGAGAGLDHPFMQTIAEGLAAEQVEVVRFNFPYMIKRQEDGKKRPPDRQPTLLAHFASQVAEQEDDLPLFIAGKSMGGRMATLLLSDADYSEVTADIKGVICLGYPFHAPGKKDQWRAEHFPNIPCPCLIIQGERDTFGNQQEIAEHPLPSGMDLTFIGDGDHSFKPRKASGLTEEKNLATAIVMMATFIKAQL